MPMTKSEAGRLGGLSKSEAKLTAARKNGSTRSKTARTEAIEALTPDDLLVQLNASPEQVAQLAPFRRGLPHAWDCFVAEGGKSLDEFIQKRSNFIADFIGY